MRAYSELARCTVSKSVVQVPHSICRNTDRGIAGSFEVKGEGRSGGGGGREDYTEYLE